MTAVSPPQLAATLHRVQDVDRAGRFFADALGCPLSAGKRPGWLVVDVGNGQALYLAPGGRELPIIEDRWQQQGVIPILKTQAVDAEAAHIDRLGARWVNRPFDYDMKGHGRLGYFLGPDNHPVGMQQRMADSVREEDLATLEWLKDQTPGKRWLGIGWLIYQAEDIVGVRDFMQQAFGWQQLRGTEGFGYMLQIAPLVMLQIAYRGRTLDPRRDLSSEAVLPVAATADVDELLRSVRAFGGSLPDNVDGFPVAADPEGHAWLVEELKA
jgi:hypothetical protein